MPICPRCGKTLSSDQALSYHLNRKYKCNTWVCQKCDTLFNTKFDLNIHQLKCLGDRCTNTETLKDKHSHNFYSKLLTLPMVFVEYDINSDLITYITPNSHTLVPKLGEIVGHKKAMLKTVFPKLTHVCDSNGISCYTLNKVT